MTVSQALRRLKETSEAAVAEEAERKARVVHPAGWEPGVTWKGREGTVTTRPTTEKAVDWNHVLQVWGLDSEQFEVVEPVEFRAWDANMGRDPVSGEVTIETLYYYKARVVSKSRLVGGLDVDEFLKDVLKAKPSKNDRSDGDGSFVVCLADWQIGKGNEGRGGSGVEDTVQRVLDAKASVAARVKELRKIGRPLGTLYVAGMGDLIERCSGNYPGQTFTTELNEREQMRVTRRLLKELVVEWSKLFDRVVVLAVGGNHGEKRQDGKKFTDDGDNDDVALFETVAEALAMNPEAFSHVSFLIPEDKLYLVLNISGLNVGFAHGHKHAAGPTAQKKQQNWWEKMTFNGSNMADADVLVTGHFHHFSQVEVSRGKTHLQCPALDSGSKWFEDIGGMTSESGVLTFAVVDGRLQDVQVLR